MPIANVFQQSFQYDEEDPPGYRSGIARVGGAAGGQENAVKEFEVPPGETICPYHYEYVEEWLLLLEGSVTLRTPEGDHSLQRGDLVCFPAGPAGAHKVTNRGDGAALVLMWSSAREPSVAIYPDSDKMGVWAGEDRAMLRRADAHVNYYEGET